LEHGLVRVDREQKLPTLSKLLRKHGGSAIIFGRTKHGVTKLNQNLRKLGHNSVELQGNLSQLVRDRAMSSFREGRSTILVATNVAARGIDVNNVGLVVNFELPDSPQWLTHRVGRTARMGEAGRALTFVSPEDEGAWVKLGRLGAPIIRELDTKRLLDEGSWHYQEGRPMQSRGPSSAPRGGANRNRGRRPWHAGGGTGGGRPNSGNSNGSRPRQST
jgi:superfamily II DNA/RNA helicase